MKRALNVFVWVIGILFVIQIALSLILETDKGVAEFAPAPIPLDECGEAYLDKNYGLAAAKCGPLADQSAEHALYIMSELYKEGLGGLSKDRQRHFAYLEQSAETKNTLAMIGFAIALQAGEHIEKNVERAFTMMSEATEMGDAFAQFWLATLFYTLGQGTDKDPVIAQKWFILAAESPSILADKELFQRVRLRQEGELTLQQIDEAERLAEAWRKKNLSRFNRLMMWLRDEGWL